MLGKYRSQSLLFLSAVLLVLSLMLGLSLGYGFGRNGRPMYQRLNGLVIRQHLSKSALSSTTAPVASTVSANVVQHPKYEHLETFYIAEYGLNGALYKHVKSGAQVISVQAPDENKVFGITFRTPPSDSTGVPHVLEHSVLCGSRKFPVKEPFVDLLKGSLQNFLNAFTYPDRTCYPVASTNTKDFYNLIHVYLDAVLHPRAMTDPQVLQQEGWHYELDDINGPLSVKGVVYNEMKGVYSSPDSLMNRATQQALFPDNTYGVDSGGDPNQIPNLTFSGFKNFHASYYHPANSRVFFYGDDDPMQRLNLLDEYLRDFDEIPVNSKVQFQSKFTAPRDIVVPFPVTPGSEPKHMMTLNWLLNEERLNAKETLALGVLDYLLLGTSSSSLRKTLTESNLGESVTGGGLSDELLQSTFSVGMKGVDEKNSAQLEELILRSVEKIAEEGFEADAVQAAMNTYEFRLREFNTGSFPKGLSVMLGMMSQWIYDQPPADGVQFEKPLQELKDDIKAGKPIFQDLLKKYLINNTHRLKVEMKPDFDMESKRIAEEEAWLTQQKASMSQEELAQVIETSRRLREAQEAVDSPEAKATLPKLGLDDIDPASKELPIEIEADVDGVDATIITHDLQTSGILYVDMVFDYSGVEEVDLELLPLFSRMLMETGTKDMDQTALSRKIGANTGGISVSYYNDLKHVAGKVADPDDVMLHLMMRGKAVKDKVPTLFELFSDILKNANLDNQKRAVEMLKESKVRKESSILSSGHSFAATRLAGRFSFLGHLNELTGGLTSVRAAGKLLEQAQNDWPALSKRLERMRNAIVKKGKDSLLINLTGDSELVNGAIPTIHDFVANIADARDSSAPTVVQRWAKEKKLLPLRNEGFSIPSQVNYVVKGGQILQPGDEVKGSYSVVSRYLSTGYLWDQVRVLGGAYGGFARFSEATGRFVFISYRDPNCLKTLQVYDETAAALSEDDLASEDVLQAVIGSIGDLDSPMSPDQKGYVSLLRYMSGETAEDRQKYRSEVLDTKSEDFKEFASHLKKLRETGTVVVFGSQQSLEEANQHLQAEQKLHIEQALSSE